MSDRDRLVELINAFYIVNKTLYIITEGKIVERIVRTFKYLGDMGIEYECTIWEKDKKGYSHLETNIVHSAEIGKTVFLTKAEAEQALANMQCK